MASHLAVNTMISRGVHCRLNFCNKKRIGPVAPKQAQTLTPLMLSLDDILLVFLFTVQTRSLDSFYKLVSTMLSSCFKTKVFSCKLWKQSHAVSVCLFMLSWTFPFTMLTNVFVIGDSVWVWFSVSQNGLKLTEEENGEVPFIGWLTGLRNNFHLSMMLSRKNTEQKLLRLLQIFYTPEHRLPTFQCFQSCKLAWDSCLWNAMEVWSVLLQKRF